ncbi:hypothetical protein BOX15_Mlig023163g1 [Macrostomum lignano]|uniref:Uncharacterized protein n=1 Tax=Macrostomum lignano TaxID=282301 RepID=A0A267EYX0_9PLAT|nr:hypothetical protein BOX15_Mlig023163g2 [Macrostomum lignano]PAA69308.1 hypothetical protein BOX15_Mlig023163g1 [Macrostomum lignano]
MTSASIPSRRSLDVQLGPAAAGDHDDYNGTCESSSTAAAAASVDELRAPTSRRTPRQSKMATTRVRWSRMAAPPGQPPAAPPPQLEPPPSLALLATGSTAAASLCQLVDFGETRDLIRRQRETAKQLEEVQSIVSHLSLEQENGQDFRQQAADWATFRKQPNSQFKQYVFQSPGRVPALPAADSDEAVGVWQTQHQNWLQHPQHHRQQHQQASLQRSRTSLGAVAGRPLGAAGLRRSERGSLSRELTRASMAAAPGWQPGLWLQGCSTDGARDEPGSLYGQFAHRKSKTFRLS